MLKRTWGGGGSFLGGIYRHSYKHPYRHPLYILVGSYYILPHVGTSMTFSVMTIQKPRCYRDSSNGTNYRVSVKEMLGVEDQLCMTEPKFPNEIILSDLNVIDDAIYQVIYDSCMSHKCMTFFYTHNRFSNLSLFCLSV